MSDLKAGMQVIHPLFGTGTIRAISGSGPDAKIAVDFSGNVGHKKLIAGAANLKPVGAGGAIQPLNAWYETLGVAMTPKAGRRPPKEKLHASIHAEIRQAEFWTAVRERLRTRRIAPRVMDEPSGCISISVDGLLNLDIRIKHGEMVRPSEAVLARAIFELIEERFLIDFEHRPLEIKIGIEQALQADAIVEVGQQEVKHLPDRSPQRRPLPVTPKGVIKSRPRGREDY